MKTVFVLNGAVVGHATAHMPGVTVASAVPGAVGYDVDDNSPVDTDWTVTLDADGNPVFTAPEAKLATLTPMQFYLAFKPSERMAIKKCTDENVAEFWATFELAQQTGSHIDPNLTSVQQALQYLAIPTTATPPGPGILASVDRIAQILNGIPQ